MSCSMCVCVQERKEERTSKEIKRVRGLNYFADITIFIIINGLLETKGILKVCYILHSEQRLCGALHEAQHSVCHKLY